MFLHVIIWPCLGATGIALHFSGVTCLFLELFTSFLVLSLDTFKLHALLRHTISGDYQMQWVVVVNYEIGSWVKDSRVFVACISHNVNKSYVQ